MSAALEARRVEAEAGEPAADRLDVHGFAAVRGAGQGELCGTDGKMPRRPAFQQDQGLQRLDRRAWKDRPLEVAVRVAQPAVGSGHRIAHPMLALDTLAPQHQDSSRNEVRTGRAHNREFGRKGLTAAATL